MRFEVKRAGMENLKDLLRLNQLLFEMEFQGWDKTLNCNWSQNNKEYFKRAIAGRNSLALIALSNGKVAGYLIGIAKKAEPFRNLEKIAELENMFVLEEFRNKGIGSRLCSEFIDWARKKKVQRARVVASTQNFDAISHYRKAGFKDYNLVLETNL